MTVDRRRHGLLGRIRNRTAAGSSARVRVTEADPLPQPTPEADASEPPRREHLYGSAYRVRVSADEVIRARGLGRGLDGYRRRIAPTDRADRRHAAAVVITGRGPDVMWPE